MVCCKVLASFFHVTRFAGVSQHSLFCEDGLILEPQLVFPLAIRYCCERVLHQLHLREWNWVWGSEGEGYNIIFFASLSTSSSVSLSCLSISLSILSFFSLLQVTGAKMSFLTSWRLKGEQLMVCEFHIIRMFECWFVTLNYVSQMLLPPPCLEWNWLACSGTMATPSWPWKSWLR